MELVRKTQCKTCPWIKGNNPYDIPDGYSVDKHRELSSTIAAPACTNNILSNKIHIMACHYSNDRSEYPCIGWLMNQLGSGNNIQLRLLMRSVDLSEVELRGEQHATFEDTLPN